MDVKEYLNQYRAIQRNIEILKIEISHLYNRPKTIKYGEAPGTAAGDTMLNTVLNIDEKKKKYEGLLKKYYQMRTAIVESIININDPNEKRTLYDYYILNKDVTDIAESMSYSKAQIYRIMEKGRENIWERIQHETK